MLGLKTFPSKLSCDTCRAPSPILTHTHRDTHILLLKVRFIRGHFHRLRGQVEVPHLFISCIHLAKTLFICAFHPFSFALARYSKFFTKTSALKPRPASFHEIQLCEKIDQKWSEETSYFREKMERIFGERSKWCHINLKVKLYKTPEEVFKC